MWIGNVNLLTEQVKQFPVVWESGQGNTMTDVDGNTYIDFSAGIYCNSTGHCHPKVVEKTKEYIEKTYIKADWLYQKPIIKFTI